MGNNATVSPIALLRFVRQLSQAELGERAGISRDTISRLERGELPRLATARALSRALGVEVADLFPENEEGHADNVTLSKNSPAVAGPTSAG
jgi:transcriptional regulator with XRE-family HTH domain